MPKPTTRTCYPNAELIHLWANGCDRDLRSSTLSTRFDGSVLYSYATPIANRLGKEFKTPQGFNVFLIRPPFYSKTTKGHISDSYHSIPFRVSFIVDEWDGRLETLKLNFNPKDSNAVFYVENVLTNSGSDAEFHLRNFKGLIEEANKELNRLKTAKVHGSALYVAEKFATARLYKETFKVSAPFELPPNALEIIAKFNARKAKAKAMELQAEFKLKTARKDWITAFAKTAQAIRECVKLANESAQGSVDVSLFDKIQTWEAGGQWPKDNESSGEPQGVELMRRIMNSVLRGKIKDLQSSPLVPHSIKHSFPSRYCSDLDLFNEYPQPPKVKAFGKLVEGRGASYYVPEFYNACGVAPYAPAPWRSDSIAALAGRDLVRISKDRADIETSGGARVSVDIAKTLFKRFGNLLDRAGHSIELPEFPGSDEGIKFGPYLWKGWEASPDICKNSKGGNYLMRVGCHLISPLDIIRLATANNWEISA